MNRQLFSRGLIALVCVLTLLPASGQAFAQLGGLLGGDDSKPAKPKLIFRLVPENAAVGDVVTAEIGTEISKESYVYSQNPNIGAETKIEISETVGLTELEPKFRPSRQPKVVIEPLLNDAKLEKFFGGVVWKKQYRVTAQNAKLTGSFNFQVCDEFTCNPYKEKFELTTKSGSATGTPPSTTDTPSLKMILEGGGDPFDLAAPSNNASDTAPKTESSTPPAPATLPQSGGKLLASQEIDPDRMLGGSPEPIRLNAELKQADPIDGQPAISLEITATVQGAWHVYALDQDPKMFALPTVITVGEIPGLTAVDAGFAPDHEPEVTRPLEDVIQRIHEGTVTWSRRFVVDPATFSGTVNGSIKYQLCEDGSCLPPNTVDFALSTTGEAVSLIADSSATSGPVEEEGSIQDQGLIQFLITGVIFGYLALLTPCVFPMIPITISFFLKQAEKGQHNPVGMASLYCLGIMATFTIIGIGVSAVFGVSGMNQLANNVWLNFFLASVLIFFGLNMLGLFEIRVPSSLLTWSSSRESGGGIIGVLFMSFTFTLVSFTCTFAFVGLLLPLAAQGNYYWPALGMLAFSAAFASPFFFLALFPSFLKSLPKSGGWMNVVKVTFGLIELGAAFKFLSVADIGIFSEAYIFDYSLVMNVWMVLGIVTGLYLLGSFRMPHDSPTDTIGVPRLGFALLFFAFAAYLASGIYGAKPPEGVLWQQIVAFAPPSYSASKDVDLGPVLEHDDLIYALDVDQAVAYAKANNEPLFFDFTGTNCVNCRAMEINVFPKPANKELLEEFVRVQLYTDTVPKMSDAEQAEAILDKNRELQSEWFNDATLPAYAIVTPDGQTILSSFKGGERKAGQFTQFLQSGLNEWQRMKTAMAPQAVRR